MSKKLYFLTTFVLLLGFGSVIHAEPNDANLVGWWKFDEGTGTMVEDASVYDNDGVTVSPSPTWVDGSPGDPCNSAMDFDGVSDYVICAELEGNNPGIYPPELMPDTFTVSCWTKLDSFTYYGGFVGNGMDGECGFFLQNGGNANNFGLSMRTSDWHDVETPNPVVYETNRWYHLAATYDGQYATVYVDGDIAQGPDDIGGPIRWYWIDGDVNYYPENFTIGSWENWDDSYPVDGVIDDVRFYNYAMEEDDIKILAGIVPGAAYNPDPRWYEDEASMYTDLSWTPGSEWALHDVYFGTNEDSVTDANTDITFGVYMGRQTDPVVSNSSLVPALEFGKTYYWRVDEVNGTDETMIKGRIWNFTVANYIVIDDMESYSQSNRIYYTWEEDTGRTAIDLQTADSNPDYVHTKDQSMEFNFLNNFPPYYSQATRTFSPPRDWTIPGIEALTLYFRADFDNLPSAVQPMYIIVSDGVETGTVEYDDPNDLIRGEDGWQEWNIALQEFADAGVDLDNITELGIKIGDGVSAAGVGYVYFDDVRIWLQRCVPDISYPYGDLTGDCFIDGFDVEVMSADWLISDYNVITTEPCDANLIGWWKFDEGSGYTVEDSSVYNNTGVATDLTPMWVEGHPNDPCDSAMYFNGITDYLLCAQRDGTVPGTYPGELMPDTFTVTCWVKLDGFAYYGGFVGNAVDGECGFYLHSAEEDIGNFGAALMTESAGWQDVTSASIYETDIWYHLGFSYDGQYASLYIDGVPTEESPQDVGGPMWWTDYSESYPEYFTIGSFETLGDSYPAWGDIDEVRFYNYALEHGEILYLAGMYGDIYMPLTNTPANLVSRVPDPAVDPQYYPENPDIVNFKDFGALADSWLNEVLFP